MTVRWAGRNNGREKAARGRRMAAASTVAAAGGPGKRKSSFLGAPALWLALALVLGHVSSPAELYVEIGTTAKLPCKFTSSEKITDAASATWSYKKWGSNNHPITFFYYSDGKAYYGTNTQFTGRSTWDGDVFKNDASIKIANMQPTDNGTYFCDVKNPPDIVTAERPIEVKVVDRENMPASSGNISSFWPFVLQFCCILASLLNYLF